MPATPTLSAVSAPALHAGSPAPDPVESKPGGKGETPPAVAREFESFVLQSFIEAMLPANADSMLGTGGADAFWRSMLAEQVARELARAGGIGVARMIGADLAARSGDDS